MSIAGENLQALQSSCDTRQTAACRHLASIALWLKCNLYTRLKTSFGVHTQSGVISILGKR